MSIIKVSDYEINKNSQMKMSAVMHHMQQSATESFNTFGITYEELRKNNMVFVLLRMKIQFTSVINKNDILNFISWPTQTKNASFFREYKIIRNDQIIATANSIWALIDYDKRTILRPSALNKEIKIQDPESVNINLYKLFESGNEILIDKRKIYSSMLDENNHLNNCVYSDIIFDYIPNTKTIIKSLQIDFVNEALENDILNIYFEKRQDSYFIYGYNTTKDNLCFKALVEI